MRDTPTGFLLHSEFPLAIADVSRVPRGGCRAYEVRGLEVVHIHRVFLGESRYQRDILPTAMYR